MVAQYQDLSVVLQGIGIDVEARDSVVEFADWTYGDTDLVLVKASKVKSVMIDFVTSNMIEEFADENELFLSEEELKYNVNDVFSSIPPHSYINITN